MQVLERLDDVSIVHHVTDAGVVYATRGREIVRRAAPDESWKSVVTIPGRYPRDPLR